MKKILYFVIPLFALVFAGCSSSKITGSSWNDSEQSPAHFNKILVVGLFDETNPNMRKQMEQQLAQVLKDEGYNAVTSYNLYGSRSFAHMSEEKILREVRDRNIDGVITIGLVDKTKEKKFVNDPRYNSPYGYYPYGRGYRSWGYIYRPYYVPGFRTGHYEIETNYAFETNLYSVNNKSLIYSIQTKSYDPSTLGKMAYDYSVSVIKNLKKNNVLG